MEYLRGQVFRLTSDFVGEVVGLARRHTGVVLSSAFASVPIRSGDGPATSGSASVARPSPGLPRGAKRAAAELEQLAVRFATFVRDNPGLRIEQINKKLGVTTAELALPIRKLVAAAAITAKGWKRSTTYFVGKNFVGRVIDKKLGAVVPAPAGPRSTIRARGRVGSRPAARGKSSSRDRGRSRGRVRPKGGGKGGEKRGGERKATKSTAAE